MFMVRTYIYLFLFTFATTLSCRSPNGNIKSAHSERPLGFPVYPRIANADPSVREIREFEIPSKLSVIRTDSTLIIRGDSASYKKTPIEVGKNMVIGSIHTLNIFYKDSLIYSRGYERSGFGYYEGCGFSRSSSGIPIPNIEYKIVYLYIIFEADLPPQHMWPYRTSNYKVIYQDTLFAISK
jgi:hypothetical protein